MKPHMFVNYVFKIINADHNNTSTIIHKILGLHFFFVSSKSFKCVMIACFRGIPVIKLMLTYDYGVGTGV